MRKPELLDDNPDCDHEAQSPSFFGLTRAVEVEYIRPTLHCAARSFRESRPFKSMSHSTGRQKSHELEKCTTNCRHQETSVPLAMDERTLERTHSRCGSRWSRLCNILSPIRDISQILSRVLLDPSYYPPRPHTSYMAPFKAATRLTSKVNPCN